MRFPFGFSGRLRRAPPIWRPNSIARLPFLARRRQEDDCFEHGYPETLLRSHGASMRNILTKEAEVELFFLVLRYSCWLTPPPRTVPKAPANRTKRLATASWSGAERRSPRIPNDARPASPGLLPRAVYPASAPGCSAAPPTDPRTAHPAPGQRSSSGSVSSTTPSMPRRSIDPRPDPCYRRRCRVPRRTGPRAAGTCNYPRAAFLQGRALPRRGAAGARVPPGARRDVLLGLRPRLPAPRLIRAAVRGDATSPEGEGPPST